MSISLINSKSENTRKRRESSRLFLFLIIFDEKKLLIGYNSEEIRKFTPALYRRGNSKMDEEY